MKLKTQNDLVYTVDEICDIFKIGKNKAYDVVRSGEIPVVKIGKQYRVPKAAFDEWLKALGNKQTNGKVVDIG